MNIFIAKLSPATTSDDLKRLFEQFGEVASAKIIFDKETKKSKCYGFVTMENEKEAKAAIENLNQSEVDKSKIVVKKSMPTKEGEKTETINNKSFKNLNKK